MKSTAQMGEIHARHVNDVLGMRHSPGSGNRWHRQTDGRHEPDLHYRFAQDSKSTLAASASVTLASWEKLVEQANGLRPILPLRFYGSTNLAVIKADLVVSTLDDFAELLTAAETYADLADS